MTGISGDLSGEKVVNVLLKIVPYSLFEWRRNALILPAMSRTAYELPGKDFRWCFMFSGVYIDCGRIFNRNGFIWGLLNPGPLLIYVGLYRYSLRLRI